MAVRLPAMVFVDRHEGLPDLAAGVLRTPAAPEASFTNDPLWMIDLETVHQPASGPDLVLRLAALLHDIGKPKTRRFEDGGRVSFHHHEVVGARMTRKRLTALRYPKDVIEQVSALVELHLRFHGYGDGDWTDSAVRRYVRDAGDQLVRLHKLTRADCTTRNKRRAERLAPRRSCAPGGRRAADAVAPPRKSVSSKGGFLDRGSKNGS